MDIYSHLEGMGFGLKELKRLWDLIGEIAEANQIDHRDAVPKFFKDIEGQYHALLHDSLVFDFTVCFCLNRYHFVIQ